MKISVVGAGSWGTAMACLLASKHQDVLLWARKPEFAHELQQARENKRYLPGISLPENLQITSELMAAVHGSDLIVLAVPSKAMRSIASQIKHNIQPKTLLLTAAKGFEPNTYKRMSEVLAEEMADHAQNIAVISGPNHAEEVGRNFPSATVIAAENDDAAKQIQELFFCETFRPYTSRDVCGVEFGGALKNIIALGAGIVDGLGYGDNTKAALMTRGLAEMVRLGVALGAKASTFSGLSGLGDLMVTCSSRHSRNRRAGLLLAEGKTMAQIEQETSMVVEGIGSTLAAYTLAKQAGVEMPITEQTYQILYHGKLPREALLDLMTRGTTCESEIVAF